MNVQRKIAAKVLKCGENRVWIDPANEKIAQAITRSDIRRFVKEGYIKKLPAKKRAKILEKSQQRRGSIRGTRKTREGKKNTWFKIIRPQRKLLKQLKVEGRLEPHTYRTVYKLIKGNYFRSKSHLESYMKEKKIVKEVKK
jgi:large subunit ribosomal protein L19e